MDFNVEKYYLKSSSFFDSLSAKEAKLVKKKMTRKEYTKNEYLFKEKSYSKGLYILRKGKVKIFQTSSDGRQSIVYIYKKGDYFGYRPLLAEEMHPVSAVALDHVVLSFIPGDLFFTILSGSSSFANNLLRALSKEFSVWINKVAVFSQFTVKERLALTLLILDKIYRRGDDQSEHAVISLSRDDLAGYVGTAKETLVRMLRTFKDEKIISTRGTKIVLLSPKALVTILTDLS